MRSPKVITQRLTRVEYRIYGMTKWETDAFIEEIEDKIRDLVIQKARQRRRHVRVDWVRTTDTTTGLSVLVDGHGNLREVS